MKKLDYTGMNPKEIEAVSTILMNLTGKHFTKSVVEYIKQFLDIVTIIDSKGDSE
jgi:hypothetical protein